MSICNSICGYYDDNRVLSKNGHVQYGHVFREDGGLHYAKKHSNNEMRSKFLGLTVASPVFFFIQGIVRLASICLLDFVVGGSRIALKEHELSRQRWSIKVLNGEQGIPSKPEGNWMLAARIAFEIPGQLIKNIIKVVAIPFAAIAKLFIDLYGLIDPVHAGFLHSDIEQYLRREGLNWSLEEKEGFLNGYADLITLEFDYSAPCMQPLEVENERNFFKNVLNRGKNNFQDASLGCQNQIIKNQFQALRCLFAQNQEFLEAELAVDQNRVSTHLAYLSEGINKHYHHFCAQLYQANDSTIQSNQVIIDDLVELGNKILELKQLRAELATYDSATLISAKNASVAESAQEIAVKKLYDVRLRIASLPDLVGNNIASPAA